VKVLIVGGGGREHALAWKLLQSRRLDELHCAPGNPGIASIAWCHPEVKATDPDGQVALAEKLRADLVVIGPDEPLALGLTDRLQARGIRAFGPTREAARLEWSKAFAKQIMAETGAPTARYASFDDYAEALRYVAREGAPLVIKADGLALGKGVRVCRTEEEARDALRAMMVERLFGDAGARVVIEEFLTGMEVSVLAVSDGTTVRQLVSAQDHKQVGEGNTGPNTGGMGTVAPVPAYTAEMAAQVQQEVLEPLIRRMRERGTPFVGCLFTGLMLTAKGPRVLEFNVRFGDPEAQVVLPLLRSDLLEVLEACTDGRLAGFDLTWHDGAACNIVVASGGYPGSYVKGYPVEGLDEAAELGVTLFHAGTDFDDDGRLVTAGGRVLGVMAAAPELRTALETAYRAVGLIRFPGAFARRDIGWQALPAAGPGR
jgi:phosphoribosylamine---glycine ligase